MTGLACTPVTPAATRRRRSAEYNLPEADDDAFSVVVRDARKSPDNPNVAGFDHIYKIDSGSGEFTAVVNGTAVIQVVRRQVLIDVTNGTVRTIEFKNAEATVKERSKGIGDRWQEYWDTSFYSPMALSRWSYDDSTMSGWFGLGFLRFLVRLALAIVLGVVDVVAVVLVVGCTPAAVAYVLFGPTGRNIVYGRGGPAVPVLRPVGLGEPQAVRRRSSACSGNALIVTRCMRRRSV
ncbi:hypothetical protein [Nonomuraea sp. NPDC052265]|uniref:hypothetical protein n=1 Tax=Nonomuraea sp. NPDC052265 TaxID=3364374 RepID=UPI0037C62D98